MSDRTITVYGSSDDMIEIEGDLREEFYYRDTDNPGNYIAFSNGTVLSIRYDDDGNWRIAPEHHGPGSVAIAQVVPGGDACSDIATVTGDIWWAVFGTHIVRVEEP